MPNKKKGKSSAQYYKLNPETAKKKREYQREYNKKEEQVKKRVELTKINREAQKRGNGKVGDGKDVSHQPGGGTKMEDASKNRGSNSNRPGDRRARPKKK